MNKERVTFMFKYAIEIFFSEDDEGYIAVVPELEGCSAFGKTPNEALDEVMDAIQSWLDYSREMGWEIPEPSLKNILTEELVKERKRPEMKT